MLLPCLPSWPWVPFLCSFKPHPCYSSVLSFTPYVYPPSLPPLSCSLTHSNSLSLSLHPRRCISIWDDIIGTVEMIFFGEKVDITIPYIYMHMHSCTCKIYKSTTIVYLDVHFTRTCIYCILSYFTYLYTVALTWTWTLVITMGYRWLWLTMPPWHRWVCSCWFGTFLRERRWLKDSSRFSERGDGWKIQAG